MAAEFPTTRSDLHDLLFLVHEHLVHLAGVVVGEFLHAVLPPMHLVLGDLRLALGLLELVVGVAAILPSGEAGQIIAVALLPLLGRLLRRTLGSDHPVERRRKGSTRCRRANLRSW